MDAVKKIKIKVEPEIDSSKIAKINRDFDKMPFNSLFTPETLSNLKKEYVETQTNLEKIKSLKESISMIQLISGDESKLALQALNEELAKLENSRKGSKTKSDSIEDKMSKDFKNLFSKEGAIGKAIINSFEKITESIKDFFKDAFNDAKNIISEMASYDLSNSLVINPIAREQALKYGLNSAQNYAFSQVQQEMGISSEEDLIWMNENQRERFAERIGYYTDKYNELANKGFFETWQNFQISWQEFKTEFAMDIAEFFVENKDEIMTVMKSLMKFMESMLKIVSDIANFFGTNTRSDTERLNATSDIINNYRTNTANNKNTNIKIDNTFNNVSKEDQTWLQNAGNMTYEQLIKAIS